MPLLLRPDEILAGSVPHAIRVTAHCAHGYVWPASHDAGTCVAGFPPMGARFRLRSGYDITRFSANTQVVLRAFERFGLIVADNGADWYFQGTTDDWWGTVAGGQLVSELKTIPAAQFDAVDESGVQVSPSSYMATAAGPASSLARAPAVAAGAMNQLEVAAVGQDRQVWHRSWNGTSWSAWDGEGGVATSDPGTASWSSTRFDVFVRGADNALWHKALDTGAWSAWERLGGTLAGGPGAATWGAGRLDVFVVGTDRGLWHKTWNGAAWTAWDSLGGILTSDPSAASTGANRLDVSVSPSSHLILPFSRAEVTTSSGANRGTARVGVPGCLWAACFRPRRTLRLRVPICWTFSRVEPTAICGIARGTGRNGPSGNPSGEFSHRVPQPHRGVPTGSTCSRVGRTCSCGTDPGTAARGVRGRDWSARRGASGRRLDVFEPLVSP